MMKVKIEVNFTIGVATVKKFVSKLIPVLIGAALALMNQAADQITI